MNLSIHHGCLSTQALLPINAHVSTAQFIGPLYEMPRVHITVSDPMRLQHPPQEITSFPPVEA